MMLKNQKNVILIMIILAFQVITLLTFVDEELMAKIIADEVSYMDEYYTEDLTNKILNDGNDLYTRLIVETGVEFEIYNALIPDEYLRTGQIQDDQLATNIFGYSYDRISSFFESIRFSMIRMYSIASWGKLMIMMIIGFVLTGYKLRQIKKTNFDYTSPLRQEYAQRLTVFMPVIVWLVIWCPLAISPFFYPLMGFILALSLSLFISNTAKKV
ncbi:hypothetical protein ABT56_18755 [Photobacterium aquae]|uniref:Conjugal transfer protein n=1 Tax=Photobacterium aquae TaxID=1195763 RepID=A0A0J1GUR9_9GAMM|nr:DUF4400 domain-containing protein [Photobacterium aquae]KLV03480.1 hypothetical protein ABT56_18755 [Photobacterium aquae]